ncbi:Uncharacterised protein [Mycobacteroides abscessus subsp. massiliense]|uniref:hypothetical protein n=1 Tax=Mycobacteroides abscessus TaxID=36809 RepID=UPI0009A86DCD|nr:hypothetical protein [Mycobacteroides abscessus]SLH68842.1 Uncharacterised protein [Mycobacteroides abscessus subsp. massiliense]SLI87957.1 Uncharacterised protein [Mycobacteroides abscessus subsp. massiliense]
MASERQRAVRLLIHVLQGDSWGLQEVVFDAFAPGKGATEALGLLTAAMAVVAELPIPAVVRECAVRNLRSYLMARAADGLDESL